MLHEFSSILDIDRSKQITVLIFLLAVAGLTGIYFAIQNIEPVELSIQSIEDSMEGRLVRITGTIDKIKKSTSGNSYWTVSDGSSITVPILDSKFKKLVPKRGDIVEIVGLVTKYKDELEVMPREIIIKQSDYSGET